MATETDAARDRVLAARAALGDELETLEASARAAVDVPAKIRRSPARRPPSPAGRPSSCSAGPRRVFRAGRRAVTGAPEPLPEAMLPKEIEKTLRDLGDDGDKVRARWSATSRPTPSRPSGTARASGLAAPDRCLTVCCWPRPSPRRARLFRTDEEGFQADSPRPRTDEAADRGHLAHRPHRRRRRRRRSSGA